MKRAVTLFLSAVLFLFIGIAGPQLHALPQQQQEQDFPSIEPLFVPQELFNSAGVPAVFSADEIVMLSLLYSELTPDSAAYKKTIQKFDELKRKITDPEIMAMPEEDRGRAILKLLYRDVLKQYVSAQSRFDVAFETGSYNCVSSALIYMAAAKAAGLDVRGQKTPDHAFCSVYISGKRIDVETTNPYGFNPGSREAIEHENVIKGYYVVPKAYYSNRQEVSDALFTGLIAGNLCSGYVDQNEYNKSVPLGAARFMAVMNDKSKAATDVRKEFDVLAANFINLVIEDAQVFSYRLEWYRSFIDRWGMTSFLQTNMDNAVNNLLVLCFDEQNYTLAQKGWQECKDYISPKRSPVLEEMLLDIFITTATDGLLQDEQLDFLNTQLEQTKDSNKQKRIRQYLENEWLTQLNTLMNNGDYKTGYDTCTKALIQLPSSTKIKTMQKSFYNNCIALIHNEFAGQANSRNYDEALRILNEGLEEFPGDKTLSKDLSDLQRILKNR